VGVSVALSMQSFFIINNLVAGFFCNILCSVAFLIGLVKCPNIHQVFADLFRFEEFLVWDLTIPRTSNSCLSKVVLVIVSFPSICVVVIPLLLYKVKTADQLILSRVLQYMNFTKPDVFLTVCQYLALLGFLQNFSS